ncbi:MAG: M23 family metallopeptidase [Armatimonadetes bacterium]|nr:M23 family metallopeptidase [Armatimonadota bacterium]
MLQQMQHTPEGRDRLAKPWNGKFITPVQGRISSPYGYRRHPIYKVRKFHTGIDIAAPHGTPIRAAGPGTVVHAKRWGGYGNCIIVDHGGGLATLYGHCSKLAVTKGQKVTQNQVIGYIGSTGLSTGPHLHFEVRKDGRHVNPKSYLP